MASNPEYNQDWRYRLRVETFQQYGIKCVRCGFNDLRALQIDHINDNGAAERASLGGRHMAGWQFYRWLKQNGWPAGYQTLCANCNMIKQFDKNYGLRLKAAILPCKE